MQICRRVTPETGEERVQNISNEIPPSMQNWTKPDPATCNPAASPGRGTILDHQGWNDRVARGFSVAPNTPVEYTRRAGYGTENPFAATEPGVGAFAWELGTVARACPARFRSAGNRPPQRKQNLTA
jgi:hypothetical protein